MSFNHDQDYYEELVDSFVEWEGWSIDEHEREEIIDIADKGISHLAYYNGDTGAIFWMDINSDGDYVVSGELHQPISVIHYLEGQENVMAPYLAQDHFSIVKDEVGKRELSYIEPLEDPTRVLRLELPFHYEQDRLEKDLDTITDVSDQISRLHSEEYGEWIGY